MSGSSVLSLVRIFNLKSTVFAVGRTACSINEISRGKLYRESILLVAGHRDVSPEVGGSFIPKFLCPLPILIWIASVHSTATSIHTFLTPTAESCIASTLRAESHKTTVIFSDARVKEV